MLANKCWGSECWITSPHRTSPGKWISLLETQPWSQLLWTAALCPYCQSSHPPLLQLLPTPPRLMESLLPQRRMVRPRWNPWGMGRATLRRRRAATAEPPRETRRTPQERRRTWKVRDDPIHYRKKLSNFERNWSQFMISRSAAFAWIICSSMVVWPALCFFPFLWNSAWWCRPGGVRWKASVWQGLPVGLPVHARLHTEAWGAPTHQWCGAGQGELASGCW